MCRSLTWILLGATLACGTPARSAEPGRLVVALRPARASDPPRIVILTTADSASAARAARRLAADPAVAWTELEQPRTTTLWDRAPAVTLPVRGPDVVPGTSRFPSDPLFVDTRQWGLANAGPAGVAGGVANADIHARDAWARTTGSNQVVLALIDTGIDVFHPDLAAGRADGSQRIAFAADLTLDALPVMADSFGHGTLVAGVMAARTNEGVHFDSLGVAGVCGGSGGDRTGCTLIPIRVTPGHGNTASSIDIARAILYAAAHGARAVNLSMAGTAPSRLERQALQDALAMGTVVVAAAGNHGFDHGDAAQYPAAYAADGLCIQVGASDPWDQRALFSSHGPGLDVVAPGLDIWTTFMTYPSAAGGNWGGYAVASGTSLAAPFVTGTLGLLCAARPQLSDTDFQNVLRMSADDLDPPGPDPLTGWGRLNADRALALVADDRVIAHVDVPAGMWRFAGHDTLTLAESGVPILDVLARTALAERWEVSARLVIPDSLADSARAWTRVTGTTTLEDGFHLPYLAPRATVSRVGRRAFIVRGSVYRLIDPRLADTTRVPRALIADSASRWLPAPPERMTFAVTLLGARRAGRSVTTRLAPVVTTPNPARREVMFSGAEGGPIEVIDTSGRRVFAGTIAPGGKLTWNLRDPGGHRLPPGVYFVRAPERAPARLVITR